MVSSSATALLRFAGWSVLPDAAARFVLQSYHKFLISYGFTVPQPGTRAYVNHHRAAFAIVVLGYLGYNLVEAYTTAPSNFYEILGLSDVDADEGTLKAAFRTFARRNHPDIAGPQGEATFIAVRDAFEALKHPVKRYAYIRFGPEVLQWSHCSTTRDFLINGLQASAGFYITSIVVMILFHFLGQGGAGAYWRYLLFASLATAELCLILVPPPTMFASLFPGRVTYQHILFLHQLFVSLSVAISRVTPVVFPSPPAVELANVKVPPVLGPIIERLVLLGHTADREVSRMLKGELRAIHGTSAPYSSDHRPDPEVINALTQEMENMILDNQFKGHPVLRPLWDGAIDNLRLTPRRPKNTERDHLSPQRTLPSPPVSVTPLPKDRSPPPDMEDSPPPESRPYLPNRTSSYRGRSLSY